MVDIPPAFPLGRGEGLGSAVLLRSLTRNPAARRVASILKTKTISAWTVNHSEPAYLLIDSEIVHHVPPALERRCHEVWMWGCSHSQTYSGQRRGGPAAFLAGGIDRYTLQSVCYDIHATYETEGELEHEPAGSPGVNVGATGPAKRVDFFSWERIEDSPVTTS